ncbi:MAG TPA: DNA repair protein RecN [Acidimicrobiales bacterium]|nr:DNA repair protein RecN [Acidimicrobiales bacterium]
MINELRVRDLGVIAEVNLELDEGMTAITGETGAGKTMIVDALELLVGGRFDPSMVRTGMAESSVEGQFFHAGTETIIRRTLVRNGRSRAFINGSLAPLSTLVEFGTDLVDLYGQHAHQSLLAPAEQRRSLDQFAHVDLDLLRQLRSELRTLDEELEKLGGDDQLRARELDLWQFELGEIEALNISSANEDEELASEHDLLAQAAELRESAQSAYMEIVGGVTRGARDHLGASLESLGQHQALHDIAERLRSLSAELDDLSAELRRATETFEEDPNRLEEIRDRRASFTRLKKKHGNSLSAVLEARDELIKKIARSCSMDETRTQLLAGREMLLEKIRDEERTIGDLRRKGAVPLAQQVESHLKDLGLDKARIEIALPDNGVADEVTYLLGANPGEAPLALSKVASGGELSRTMLALRLVLNAGPSTLVFDEVDAGIGGEAALAVGRALRELGRDHQVIVVTHLAQVAAFADNQLVVHKDMSGDRTLAHVEAVEGEERISELARMLSGHPDSENARRHAAELLEKVARERQVSR